MQSGSLYKKVAAFYQKSEHSDQAVADNLDSPHS
jgi:hypothetical protein